MTPALRRARRPRDAKRPRRTRATVVACPVGAAPRRVLLLARLPAGQRPHAAQLRGSDAVQLLLRAGCVELCPSPGPVARGGTDVWLCAPALWRAAGADHYLTEAAAGHGREDAALKTLVAELSLHGALPRAAEDGEFYGAAPAGGAHPLSEASYRLPALLASLAPTRGALPAPPQPPALALPLYAYQRQAVAWMLAQERQRNTARNGVLSPLWAAHVSADGRTLYANLLTGTLTLHTPHAPRHTLLRGGILAVRGARWGGACTASMHRGPKHVHKRTRARAGFHGAGQDGHAGCAHPGAPLRRVRA
jgi:hypothetical protein